MNWVTPFEVIDRTLVVRFSQPRRVISSAVRGGGIGWAHAILNHHVSESIRHSTREEPRTQQWENPSRTLGKIADRFGIPGRCVGFLTAVDLRNLVVIREQEAGLWVEGLFTIGVTNAVRAGEPTDELSRVGTINIILVTNAKLTMAALVGAVTVATEIKTALLMENHIPSISGRAWATGTGTDSMVIAIGDGPRLRYSGTHTKMGELIGRVVARGMREGLDKIIVSNRRA